MDNLEELVIYETDLERAAIVGYQLCEQFGIDPAQVILTIDPKGQVIITIDTDGNE